MTCSCGADLAIDCAVRLKAIRDPEEGCLVASNNGHHDHIPVTVDDTTIDVVEFVSIAEFVANPVQQAEPIVVDADGSTVIAADGLGITYGDGGAGKTTLWMDGAMHFAAGDPWLGGLLIPARPLKVGWIENEGPQEEFRRKLERKLAAWGDRLPPDSFHVLKAPWGALNLTLTEHREGIAAAIRTLDLDILFLGPLNDLGMVGGGTPDEVRNFHTCLKDVQKLADRLVSLMVLHHENTAGRISGAWAGKPDLLVHVTAQGNGKTRVLWQKAKWSSSLHNTSSQLHWAEHEGFELADAEPNRPERTWAGIEEYVLKNGGTAWGPVMDAVSGKGDYLAKRRDQMLADGLIINVGKGQRFVLWHRDDPARPALDLTVSLEGKGWEKVDSPPGDAGPVPTFSPFPPLKGKGEREKVGTASPGAPEPVDDEHEPEEVATALRTMYAVSEGVDPETYVRLHQAVEEHIAANGPTSLANLMSVGYRHFPPGQAARLYRERNPSSTQSDRDAVDEGTEIGLREVLDVAAKQGALICDEDGDNDWRWRLP
jgi:hypothetical protein